MSIDDNEFARYLASFLKEKESDLVYYNFDDIACIHEDMLEIHIKAFMETLP